MEYIRKKLDLARVSKEVGGLVNHSLEDFMSGTDIILTWIHKQDQESEMEKALWLRKEANHCLEDGSTGKNSSSLYLSNVHVLPK